jgi:hypothetical protein
MRLVRVFRGSAVIVSTSLFIIFIFIFCPPRCLLCCMLLPLRLGTLFLSEATSLFLVFLSSRIADRLTQASSFTSTALSLLTLRTYARFDHRARHRHRESSKSKIEFRNHSQPSADTFIRQNSDREGIPPKLGLRVGENCEPDPGPYLSPTSNQV